MRAVTLAAAMLLISQFALAADDTTISELEKIQSQAVQMQATCFKMEDFAKALEAGGGAKRFVIGPPADEKLADKFSASIFKTKKLAIVADVIQEKVVCVLGVYSVEDPGAAPSPTKSPSTDL